eukprot:1156951-Pelagomonas_calceolata.AAC.2
MHPELLLLLFCAADVGVRAQKDVLKLALLLLSTRRDKHVQSEHKWMEGRGEEREAEDMPYSAFVSHKWARTRGT